MINDEKYSKKLKFDHETHNLIFFLLFCCFRCKIWLTVGPRQEESVFTTELD